MTAARVAITLSLAIVAIPLAGIADGGYFTQTPHGNPNSGAQRDAALPKGSCAQCHVGHGQNPQDAGLWTANDNNLCFACHPSNLRSYPGQTLYSSSGHAVSTSSMDSRPVGRCVQCHNPHGAGDNGGIFPHLTTRLEEDACFTCHGTGFRPAGAADIQTAGYKVYAHSVTSFRRKHDDEAERTSLSVRPNPLLSGAGRHVECMDCHNVHYARRNPKPDRSSNIGESQLGSWGIRPNYTGLAWTAPSSYAVQQFQDTATNYQYYLCFKCHTDWAWGAAAPYTRDGLMETNVAIEFNPSNPAYHNVTGQPSASVPTDDVVFGSGSPPAYINSWGPNSAMACTDCHASDAMSGGARGPHGSTFSYMLKKRFQAKVGMTNNTGSSGTQSDLCFDCHDWNTYGQGGSGSATNFRKGNANLHRMSDHARAGCFQCHSAVPHGFKRKHMIVYVADGSPYYQSDPTNYAQKKGGIEAYAPANGGAYTQTSCRAGCHGGHQQANPVNPLP